MTPAAVRLRRRGSTVRERDGTAAQPRRRSEALRVGLPVAAAYLAVSIGVWWDVWTGHPTSDLTCGCGDPALFVWSFGWIAHAIAHGHNPFLSTAIFHPDGMNLLANTTAPLEAFALAPVTWIAGPVASLNVANTLAPAASAFATYWAVRRVLRVGILAGLVAGLVVELSPFVVGNAAVSHLQVTLLAFVPVIWVSLHELLVRQRGSWRRWAVLLAVAVVGQFLSGTELLAIVALFALAAVAVVAARLAFAGVRGSPTARHRSAYAAKGLAVAGLLAGGVLAYPAWFALSGPRHISGAPWPGLMPFAGVSAAGIVTPQPTGVVGPLFQLSGYAGPVGQLGGYLGVGAVLVALAAVALLARRPAVWMLAGTAVAAAWLSLGSGWLPPGTRRPAWLPFLAWRAVDHLPVLSSVLPQNIAVITLLAVAGLVALIVDAVARSGRGSTRLAARGAAVALGALVLVPLTSTWRLPLQVTDMQRPPWFAQDAPRLPAGSVVLAYPFPGLPGDGRALVWQAVGGMPVALAGGFGLVPGADGHADPGSTPGSATAVLGALSNDGYGALPGLDDEAGLSAVRTALSTWQVTTVVVTDTGRDPAYAARWFTTLLHRPPDLVDGSAVWTISTPSSGR